MFVDLHIHSYFSDGAQTPEQAALLCRDSGVGLAALCDHNSWLGCERFAAACRMPPRFRRSGSRRKNPPASRRIGV